MSNNNVLAIDEKIRQKFESDYSKLPSYKEKLADLEKSLGSESLSARLRIRIEGEYERLAKDKNFAKKARKACVHIGAFPINHSDIILAYLGYFTLLQLEDDSKLTDLYKQGLKRKEENLGNHRLN